MFNITSGNIFYNALYIVFGAQSVVYNGVTYNTGQTFRGLAGVKTFTFSGTGTQLVYQLTEFMGDAIVYEENALDAPVFPETTVFSGFAIEYMQNADDIIFNEKTTIQGFAIELLDYPLYAFEITKRIY